MRRLVHSGMPVPYYPFSIDEHQSSPAVESTAPPRSVRPPRRAFTLKSTPCHQLRRFTPGMLFSRIVSLLIWPNLACEMFHRSSMTRPLATPSRGSDGAVTEYGLKSACEFSVFFTSVHLSAQRLW